jgi:STE24 endopeptidase
MSGRLPLRPRFTRSLGLVAVFVLLVVGWGAIAHAAPPEIGPVPAEALAVPLDVDAATRAYLATVPPSAHANSDAYFEGGYWIQLWSFLLGTLVNGLLLQTGLSARAREAAERVTRRPSVHVALYWAAYIVATTVLTAPFVVYTDFFREHAYGLSNMTFGAWMGDQAKGLGISIVLGGLFVPILYAVVRRAPRTWWAWGAVASMAMMTFAVVIVPVFVAPLFNRYTPLADATVRDPILALARANGIEAHDVWEFDASRQSKRVSANVSGFGATERISLNDNLLQRCSLPEIEAVMSHEMGHYVLHHIGKSLLEIGVVILLGFLFVKSAFERLQRRFAARWRVRDAGDPAGLPLAAALLGAYFFVMTPVVNSITRTSEAEADLFGINASRQPDGMAQVALKLGEYRKLDPGPLEELVFFDHPSGRNRIRMAMKWKAEHVGDARLP